MTELINILSYTIILSLLLFMPFFKKKFLISKKISLDEYDLPVLNILFLTNLFFNELFIKMSAVEKLIKKNKILENGPRRIDLDLIQFENLKVKNHLISIPHPSSHLRDFVIQPVLDLNPNFIDLKTQYTYKRLINNLEERFIIKKSRQTQDYQGFF